MSTGKSALASDTLQRLRQEGASRFQELGWPTTRLEQWRYTNLANAARKSWRSGDAPRLFDASATLAGRAALELLFVNGRFVSMSGDGHPGVMARPLSAHGADHLVEEHLGRYALMERNSMVALNAAHCADGAVIEIAPNSALEGFIHLLFVGQGEAVWSHPRNLVVAGRAAQVTVVETYVGSGEYLTNAVTEVVAGEGSVIDHYKVTRESAAATHIATLHFQQQRASSVTSRNVTVGGALVRNDLYGALDGEGASLTLEGLFVANGQEHIDNHTVIDHIRPHCQSQELYKGILDDHARGVFDGTIIVRPNAQKTSSRQENHNLLLSETAVIDSKPTLEIHNDDVKCNHGSTIGQIEEEPVFYLRSRGLSEERARSLLIYAFASELVDRMKIEPVREQIRRALFEQMPDRMPERREVRR